MNRSVGIFVIVGGICLVVLGLLIYSGGFSWFGRLPGYVRYRRKGADLLSHRVHAVHFTRAELDLLSD